MTLLITVAAAVAATLVWYTNDNARTLKIGTLALAYWSAALMWLVDSVVEYLEVGSEFFAPAPLDMLNDAFLGISVCILALAAWVAYILIKDPKSIIRKKI